MFIHGFNNRFEDSVYRFAQIVHDSGVHSAPILVTWPSRGSLLAYGYDRESTNFTRNALETLFQFLAKDSDVKEVSILAHSMGNWLALESLRQMAIRNGRLPEKFKNVMLAAPDVDVDVFRQQIESTYDWETQDWSVPINFTVAKLITINKQPISLTAGIRYWADAPDNGPNGLGFRVALTFLFPK